MPHAPDAHDAPESAEQGLPALAATSATAGGSASGGRPLTAGVSMLATAVAVTGLLVGGLLTAVSLTGHVFGAWPSPRSLNPGLVGAAMLGTAPGLFAVGRAGRWEEARTLLHPWPSSSSACSP